MQSFSSYLDKAKMAWRYGLGLPRFFLKPLSLQDCYDLMRRRVEERETNFLAQLRLGVYSHLESPYYKLLRHAGCEYGDVERMMRQEGLEKALERLNGAGVYITIEEYKGRKPVERPGLSLQTKPEDFDNPHALPSIEARSSGTRGPSTGFNLDFVAITENAAKYAVSFDVLGVYGAPYVLWTPLSRQLLYGAKMGTPPVEWFLPLSSYKNKIASFYAIAVGRLLGHRLPWPEYIGAHEAFKVAESLARRNLRASSYLLYARPSSSVRLSMAARERGLDISHVHIVTSGEPLTPVREREIKAAGCKVTPTYASSETGFIACGCINSTGDDVHLFKGHVAVIQQARGVGDTGITVNAFRFTSLLPSARKILINMETGDYGTLERRACGCKFDALGLTDHLSHIRSYEKLTGEGVTFFASDLARIMEEILPAKFGGSVLDYQALEEEGSDGIAHLSVLVSPSVGRINEAALVDTLLKELRRNGGSSGMMSKVWQEAGTVKVRREEPRPTKGGKVFSFQVESLSSQEN